MFDFSGDEGLCMIVSGIIAAAGMIAFYRPLFSIPLLGRSIGRRVVLAVVPPATVAGNAVVICRWSDPQVAGHLNYVLLFLIVEIAWLALAVVALRGMGISIRDDVIDRNNPAVFFAVCGTIIGVSVVYALANVGGGPTIWTTIGPAAAATFVFFFAVWLMEWLSGGMIESITIDRDVAAGLRLAGASLACGIVLGRAAGGLWISLNQAWFDLVRLGWPVIIIAIFTGSIHRIHRPTPARPQPCRIAAGVIPATILLIAGITAVALMPHAFHLEQW